MAAHVEVEVLVDLTQAAVRRQILLDCCKIIAFNRSQLPMPHQQLEQVN